MLTNRIMKGIDITRDAKYTPDYKLGIIDDVYILLGYFSAFNCASLFMSFLRVVQECISIRGHNHRRLS